MKSGQVLDDPGCASFNTGVTRCSVFQKSRGFPEILDRYWMIQGVPAFTRV